MILLLTKLILNSKLRGTSRLVRFAARRSNVLQNVPVGVLSRKLFLDLRLNSAQALFLQSGGGGASEPELEVIKKIVRAGDAVYDIGAHLGLYAIHLAEAVGANGRVFAFEPNRQVLPVLRRTIDGLPNARLFESALSHQSKTKTLAVPDGDATMASLMDWTEGRHGKIQFFECETATLDELIEKERLPAPDFIKCDIEGGEYDCFRGGANTLNRSDAPLILFEANRNSTRGYGLPVSQAFDFLASLTEPQYSFYLIGADARLEKIDSISAEIGHANILAVPRAKAERLTALDLKN